MFKKGDKYIHFAKWGSVNVDIVKDYGESGQIDLVNGAQYEIPYIVNSKGILLHLDGSDGKIYKLTKQYDKDELEKLKKNINHLKELKSQRYTDLISSTNWSKKVDEIQGK